MESAVRRMIERRVEGVAIMTFGMEEVLLEDLKLRKVPLVFVDVGPPRPRVSNIRIDYLHGIRQAVQHLAALRHEKIAFITGPLRLEIRGGPKAGIPAFHAGNRPGDRSGSWWLKATIPWKAAWRLSPIARWTRPAHGGSLFE